MKTKILILLILTAVIATFLYTRISNPGIDISQCTPTNQGIENMHSKKIVLKNAQGANLSFDTLIANDSTERAFGFQYICPQVVDSTTILFVFDYAIDARFHMRNVMAPLDIGFFDEKGRLIDTQVMQPYKNNEKTTYGPGKPFKYALEARVGFFREHNLIAGQTHLVNTAF